MARDKQSLLAAPTHGNLAVGALVLACAGEGVAFPLLKAFTLRASIVAPGLSGWFVSFTLLSGRFLAAAALLVCFERSRPTRAELAQGLWIGAFAGGGHLLQADGLIWTTASTSAFFTQAYVVVLPLLGVILARRYPDRRLIVAVFLNLAALAVLARLDLHRLTLGRGEAETLLAALLFAGQIFSVSVPSYRENRTGPVTLVMFLLIGLGSIPFAIASARPGDFVRLTSNAELWALLAFLTLLSTLCPFVLMNRFQRYVSAAEAGVIYAAEPLFASGFALFLPAILTPLAGVAYANERLSARLMLGAALVTLSNWVLQRRRSEVRSAVASAIS